MKRKFRDANHKRSVSIGLTAAVVLSLAVTSCGSSSGNDTSGASSESTEETSISAVSSSESTKQKRDSETESSVTESKSDDSADSVSVPVDTRIDLEELGVTDIRNTRYTTWLYRKSQYSTPMIPLKFEDALVGLHQINLDNDDRDELLTVTFDEYAASDSGANDAGYANGDVTITVYENTSTSADSAADWCISDSLTIHVTALMSEYELTMDVFTDENGNLYYEQCGLSNIIADGLEYKLSKFTYDGSSLEELPIGIYTESSKSLGIAGSDDTAYSCLNLKYVSDTEAYESDYINSFVDAYYALGLNAESLWFDDMTTDQDASLTKICRIMLRHNIDTMMLYNINNSGGDLTSAGSIEMTMTDYQNIEAANSGVDRTEGESALESSARDTDSNDYILPDSSTSYLTASDISGLSASELRLARNEIYARHGRLFNSQDLQEYFNSKFWYNGTIPADQFSDSLLNQYEKANINLIISYE